ncbi:hypothetical protein DPMN_166666 [Dreissena polymorpha]|uniref:Uncharacterized protein n=1 Tax=Dreissena polymorpha TaxID=45954 RepID=A0A9D4EZA5_DREPO|nr:hypothetical protein DPMN_166666 [Dreissena polymorpha]
MNWLGYGPCIRKARTDGYKESDRRMTAGAFGILRCVTTGSKAEGLTSVLESDIDVMVIVSGFVCTEDGVNYSSLPNEIAVFKIYTDICYHGHCRLLLERRSSMVYRFV